LLLLMLPPLVLLLLLLLVVLVLPLVLAVVPEVAPIAAVTSSYLAATSSATESARGRLDVEFSTFGACCLSGVVVRALELLALLAPRFREFSRGIVSLVDVAAAVDCVVVAFGNGGFGTTIRTAGADGCSDADS
jgi:hypothetical protein